MFALVVFALLVSSVSAFAQVSVSTDINCTDQTQTNCTVKKNAPFHVASDPAPLTDTTPTEKWRLYVDGVAVMEQTAVLGSGASFYFSAGMSATGDHTLFIEAIGSGYDSTGTLIELASGPSNVVTVHIVNGSLSAPKNVRIVK